MTFGPLVFYLYNGEEIAYSITKRKKATRLLSSMGFTRPMSPKHSGYVGNIYRNSRDVKIEGVPFSDVFEETKTGPFALRAPVEETKDLIAVHNATEKMSVDCWG